ncbi:MAG: TraB/GumN family protein, partial [Ilyomonas sp.]
MKLSLAISLMLITVFAVAQSKEANTLLWKISGKDIKSPSYLYGTFHLMCPDDIKVTTELKNCFDATKQLYLEIDMDDPALMQQMLANTVMRGDTTLPQLLTKAEYDTLSARFQSSTGIPLLLLNNLKPFLSMAAVFPSLLGCNGEDGWEKKLMEMAKSGNKEIKGLETVKDQLSVIDSIPYTIQAKMLLKTVMNMDSTKKGLQQLIEVYKAKDLNKILELTKEDEEFSNYNWLMIDKRNANWIPVIAQQASVMPTFFAVGAGHLGGNNGLV